MGQENERISCRYIDVEVSGAGEPEQRLIEQLLAEISGAGAAAVVALRGGQRWEQSYEPLRVEAASEAIRPLRERGVYVITGGLGGVGLLLAEYLAEKVKARVVLLGRREFPARAEWEEWLQRPEGDEEVKQKLRQLQGIEEQGGEVWLVRADVSSEEQMGRALEEVKQRYGAIHGVIHAAGLAGERAVKVISEADLSEHEAQFDAKVYGLYALEKVLHGQNLDFCLLFSSNASVLGGLGLVGYSAANLFMDSFAKTHNGSYKTPWISVNWDGWLLPKEAKLSPSFHTSVDQYAMTPDESVEAFRRIIFTLTPGQIVVSTGDLPDRLNTWIDRKALAKPSNSMDL